MDSAAGHAFGWAPVGERLLREYSRSAGAVESAPTIRYAKTWREIKDLAIMPQLQQLAVQQMALLHAVDCMPLGGMCQGDALKESLRRYERLWLPLLVQQFAAAAGAAANGDPAAAGAAATARLVPPPDVALLWHLHRLQPGAYAADCRELRLPSGRHAPTLHVPPAQAFVFSDGGGAAAGSSGGACSNPIDAAGAATAALWAKAHPGEPFWPPAAPGPATAAFRSRLSADLAAVAVRVPVFTHQLLRAAYVSGAFLSRAVDRYAKFLLLRKHHLELQHPIPPLDIALMWACHMSASRLYAADCQQLLQRPFLDLPGASASLWLERDASGPWRFHWTDTQRAWLDEFSEPFVVPASGYVPLSSAHPAEAAPPPQLLAALEAGGSSSKAQQPWRAGAHALYLTWLRDPNLQAQLQYRQQCEHFKAAQAARAAELAAQPALPPPPPQEAVVQPAPSAQQKQQEQRQQRKAKNGGGGGGLFACFGCGGAAADEEAALSAAAAAAAAQRLAHEEQQRAAAAAAAAAAPRAPHPPALVPLLTSEQLMRLAEGFAGYQHLPLSASHPYWLQLLLPRLDGEALGSEAGAEVEVFTTPSGSKANGTSARRQDRAGAHDQGGLYSGGDYEVAAAGGAPLTWS